MRWPWRRHAPDPCTSDEAHEALQAALDHWPAVQHTVGEMKRLRRENHFADKMKHALEGPR